MLLTIFDKVQYIEVSSALQCTVDPTIPKIPDPNIPPLFTLPFDRTFAIYIY